MSETVELKKAKDYATDQDVKWCPGCGDYSILKQVQSVFAELQVEIDNTVFISGIGCSSRFPYYMNTYGMHSIHGRAPAFAAGLKSTNPNLNVWLITGDGDSMSIGGNHFIHLLRRNVNLNVLLFNNEIYGLTKGQYSPTSPLGKVAKSTPMGSVDHPFNPAALALGADASFVGRTMDRDPKHMQATITRAEQHQGTSFLEIYQNCNIFNDGAFEIFTEKSTKQVHGLFVEQGKPLTFGANGEKGIRFDGMRPEVVEIGDKYSADDMWIHDEKDFYKAQILTRLFDNPSEEGAVFPRPFGIFYTNDRPCYEQMMSLQIEEALAKGAGDLDKLIRGKETWEIK